MILPKLLSLSSTDLDAGALPRDPDHCLVSIVATIGPSSGIAGDNFSFLVATPSALAEAGTYGWGRGILIVESFSWAVVERSINRLITHAARDTWQEVAQALNKELLWESDSYQPG